MKRKTNAFDFFNIIGMILLSLVLLYPFYQCVIIAVNDGSDLTYNGMIYLWPRKFTLDSFKYMLNSKDFLLAVRNSVGRTIFGSLISVLVTSGFAFAISHKELVGRKLYTTLGLISMYFSGGLIPTFLNIRALGLYDNYFVYLLPSAFSMFNAMVFLSYFRGIPRDLEESAKIDGANEAQYFFKILIPIAKPVFACVLLFVAVGQWNSYYDCMIYTRSEELIVLAHRFAKMLLTSQFIEQRIDEMAAAGASAEQLIAMRGPVSSLTTQMAAMVLTVAPIMFIYPFLQKYFVKGIMVGSLKG